MPRSSRVLGDGFARYAGALNRTRSRTDALVVSGQITTTDADRFYQGLFLSLITLFEDLLEELFIGLIVEGRGYECAYPVFANRVVVRSHSVARGLVLGGQQYVAWLPYTNTETLARAYFRNGVPFTLLDGDDKGLLTRCRRIRNALAHQSEHALTEFREKVIGRQVLPAREKTPVGYLRGVFRVAPAQTRFENLSVELVILTRKLTG